MEESILEHAQTRIQIALGELDYVLRLDGDLGVRLNALEWTVQQDGIFGTCIDVHGRLGIFGVSQSELNQSLEFSEDLWAW